MWQRTTNLRVLQGGWWGLWCSRAGRMAGGHRGHTGSSLKVTSTKDLGRWWAGNWLFFLLYLLGFLFVSPKYTGGGLERRSREFRYSGFQGIPQPPFFPLDIQAALHSFSLSVTPCIKQLRLSRYMPLSSQIIPPCVPHLTFMSFTCFISESHSSRMFSFLTLGPLGLILLTSFQNHLSSVCLRVNLPTQSLWYSVIIVWRIILTGYLLKGVMRDVLLKCKIIRVGKGLFLLVKRW